MKAPGHGEHGGARARRAHEQQRQGLLLVADHPRRAGAAPHRRRLRIVSLLRLTTPRRRPFVHGHRLLPQITLTRRLPLVAHRPWPSNRALCVRSVGEEVEDEHFRTISSPRRRVTCLASSAQSTCARGTAKTSGRGRLRATATGRNFGRGPFQTSRTRRRRGHRPQEELARARAKTCGRQRDVRRRRTTSMAIVVADGEDEEAAADVIRIGEPRLSISGLAYNFFF